VYPVIVDPFATAPLKVTTAEESPPTAEIVLTALAAPCGVTAADVPPDELPTALFATIVNVYEVPLVKPVHE
jgi:hypothetical protein